MLAAVQPYFIITICCYLFIIIILFFSGGGGVVIGTRFGGILYCKLDEKPFLHILRQQRSSRESLTLLFLECRASEAFDGVELRLRAHSLLA